MGSAPDLSLYPDQPGIYIYRDARGKVLYVGKARSIRKRLASYFQAGPKHPKTEALLAQTNASSGLSRSDYFGGTDARPGPPL